MNNSSSYNTLDAQYKTIKHIKPPIKPEDRANKQYIDKITSKLLKKLKNVDDFLSQLDTDIKSVKTNIDSVKQKNKK